MQCGGTGRHQCSSFYRSVSVEAQCQRCPAPSFAEPRRRRAHTPKGTGHCHRHRHQAQARLAGSTLLSGKRRPRRSASAAISSRVSAGRSS